MGEVQESLDRHRREKTDIILFQLKTYSVILIKKKTRKKIHVLDHSTQTNQNFKDYGEIGMLQVCGLPYFLAPLNSYKPLLCVS